MVNKWKITAIIFMILFSILLTLNIWTITYVISEEDSLNYCYYNICGEYPNAVYEDGLCTCYFLNEHGEYDVAMTTYGFKK